MTSVAERRRRKRASRRILQLHGDKAQPGRVSVLSETPTPIRKLPRPSPSPENTRVRAGGMTDLQEETLRWFGSLRSTIERGGADGNAAQEELTAARSHITSDEYSVLCERLGVRGQYTAYRVGRSQMRVRELEMSALRKLVVYRQMSF